MTSRAPATTGRAAPQSPAVATNGGEACVGITEDAETGRLTYKLRSVETARTLFFTIPGPPRTKKNHGKIWRVGKRKIVKPSDAWLEWRDAVLAWFLKQPASWRREVSGLDQPTNCEALFYRDANRGDATGYYQGLADVLEELGVVENDCLITQWDGSRLRLDRTNPRVELVLTPVPPSPTTAAGGPEG